MLLHFICFLQAQKCGANPFITELRYYLSYIQNQDLQFIQQINDYITSDPKSQNLKVCSQFKQSSCCTTDFENKLLDITFKFYLTQVYKKFYIGQFLSSFNQAISQCTGTTQQKKPDSSASLKNVLDIYRLQILKIIKANIRLIRGNLCILCIDPSQYNDFIDISTKKIKVNQASIENYNREVADALNQLQLLNVPLIKAVQEYYNSFGDNTRCYSIINQAYDYINTIMLCPGGDCQIHAKNRVGLFRQKILSELETYIVPQFIKTTNVQSTRILSFEDYYTSQEIGGLITYISQDNDQYMSYEGIREATSTVNGKKIIFMYLIFLIYCVLLS